MSEALCLSPGGFSGRSPKISSHDGALNRSQSQRDGLGSHEQHVRWGVPTSTRRIEEGQAQQQRDTKDGEEFYCAMLMCNLNDGVQIYESDKGVCVGGPGGMSVF